MSVVEFLNDVVRFKFLYYALLAGLLASVACGIIGSYVTVRKISAIAGAIAHSVLGGMGAALYLNHEMGFSWITPFHGAVAASLVSALVIGILTMYGKQREDTILGAIWAVGMAVGLFFIHKTSGYTEDLMSYLFGNILMVRKNDLILLIILDLAIICITGLYYNRVLAICFDEEFSRLRGVKTSFFYMLLLCLTALTIVMLVQIVGIVMVIALLTLPAATASHIAKRMGHMMVWSVGLSAVFTTGGLVISYKPNLPAGATIILFAGSVYFIILIVSTLQKKRIKKSQRVYEKV